MPFSKRTARDLLTAAFAGLLTIACWAYQENRIKPANWQIPFATGGDGALVSSWVKAASEGDFAPLLSKNPKRLGAPFVAEWNSWPITEEFLAWGTGVIARIIGIFPAIALTMLSAHLFACLAFFYTARRFGRPRLWAGTFAVLFGLSHYIFARGLGHLTIGFSWHVPLCWLVISYAWSRGGLGKTRRRVITAILVSVVAGIQNPYFTFIYVQFLFLAGIIRAMRQRRLSAVVLPMMAAAIALVAFIGMQLDTLMYLRQRGHEHTSVVRSYTDMELYVLKPFDLILPITWPISFLQQRLAEYAQQRIIPAEHPLTYGGIIVAVGALLLIWVSFREVVVQRQLTDRFLKYALPASWIVGLGMAGGVLGLIALLTKFYFFRAANRFSIYVILLLYLFLAETCARRAGRFRPVWRFVVALLILVSAFLDLPAKRTAANDRGAKKEWKSTQKFVSAIEDKVGAQAMIFILPVLEFPEVPPRYQEKFYAPLELYLAHSTLRLSYGNDKGHFRDSWQRECEGLAPDDLVSRLQRYGFSGIIVYGDAYKDGGAELRRAFEKTGNIIIISPSKRTFFIQLQPVAPNAIELPSSAGFDLGKADSHP